ncbi:MAG: HAD family hydrolase, partial [Actinobacteria bacterium]|nr:HAD family hydrolase [Actinomycetota bacterium]
MTPGRGCARVFLFDLDDTLIDRHDAFRRWARSWIESRNLPETAREWLLANDWDGVRPRDLVFGELRERFGLKDSVRELGDEFEATFSAFLEPITDPLLGALTRLRRRGWRIG